MKTTSPFAGLMRQSPFKPIQKHMRIVSRCVAEMRPLFDAMIKKDREQINALVVKIGELEGEADQIKNELRLRMPKRLLMAVARRDLLSLIQQQDAIADTVEKISQIVAWRDMEIPEAIEELLLNLVQHTTDICSQAAAMIEQLDELLAVGFGGKQSGIVSEMITNVKRSEHKIDFLISDLNRTLFSIEDRLNPVSAMFWYQLIELIGDISNQAENMGDRLTLFIAS
ncbi:TIGR00153 family protein [Desulfococcaceae bacterium HSG9]|nr:TIGR00153 family protein [Desulfococcaceae bacterium HSG9]